MAGKIVKKPRDFLENTEKNGNSHFEKRNLPWKKSGKQMALQMFTYNKIVTVPQILRYS